MATRTLPVFFLLGVNLSHIYDRYLRGEWSRPISDLCLTKINTSNTTQSLVSNPTASEYTLRDNYNSTLIFCTTNTSRFEAYSRDGVVLEPRKILCEGCKTEQTCIPLGYPIHHEEKIIVSLDNSRKHVNHYLHCFWTQGEFHSFECAMKEVMKLRGTMENVDYNHVFGLLCSMFSIMYPGQQLLPAPDHRLLTSHGGSVPPEEYFSGQHCYRLTSRLTIFPLKIEFMRQTYSGAVDFYRHDTRRTGSTTQMTQTTDV